MITIFENFIREFKNDEDMWTAYEVYDEIYHEEFSKFIEDIAKGVKNQYWEVLQFERVNKIWSDFYHMGGEGKAFVRNEKGLGDISNLIIRNIIKLDINTKMAGHTENSPIALAHDEGYYFKGDKADMGSGGWNHKINMTWDKFDDKMSDYIYDKNWGQWRISDYALQPLLSLCSELILAKSPEEKILLCDRVFDVIHQRGDISKLFISGGRQSLDRLHEN